MLRNNESEFPKCNARICRFHQPALVSRSTHSISASWLSPRDRRESCLSEKRYANQTRDGNELKMHQNAIASWHLLGTPESSTPIDCASTAGQRTARNRAVAEDGNQSGPKLQLNATNLFAHSWDDHPCKW